MKIIKSILVLLLFVGAATTYSFAQSVDEPVVIDLAKPRNLYDEGFRTAIGFNAFLNDNGFGIGGTYRKGLKPYTEAFVTLRIAGLRDPSEQIFVGFFGQRTIPNKFKRAVVFPALFGLKRRIFPESVSDNFRAFVSGAIGPSLVLTYPYFNDANNNGFRDIFADNTERINDVFTGFSDSEWDVGVNGEFTVGIDFGENFSRLTSFQVGYLFYYFPDGLQILEPLRANLTTDGQLQLNANGEIITEPFRNPTKFFGTPQISFTFGGFW